MTAECFRLVTDWLPVNAEECKRVLKGYAVQQREKVITDVVMWQEDGVWLIQYYTN